jgi:hypothetical protein
VSTDIDTLLEQLADQVDALNTAKAHVGQLQLAVGVTCRAIAEATGGVFVPAAPPSSPPPAPEGDEDDDDTDESPPVEPARTSLFGGQKRLPPTPPNTRKAPPVLSEGAGDEPEDDDEDDQGDDEHEGADDDEGEEQPAPKRKAAGGRPTKPGGLSERILELLRERGPMKAGDITKALGAQKNPVSGALSYLASKGTLTKAPVFGAPYALAKGAR